MKDMILLLAEPEMPSARACQEAMYFKLGLVDSAVSAVARHHKVCGSNR